MPTAVTLATLVPNSATIRFGTSYERKIGVTVKVIPQGGGKPFPVLLDVERDSGPSWRGTTPPTVSVTRARENILLGISRLTDVKGMREEAIRAANSVWDNFTPTAQQVEDVRAGTYDRQFTASVSENERGEQVRFELSGIPYAGAILHGQVKARLFEGAIQPGAELDITWVNNYTNFWDGPMAGADTKHIASRHTGEIVKFLKPALLRIVATLLPQMRELHLKALEKDVKWHIDSVENHRRQLAAAREALTGANTAHALFLAKLHGDGGNQ